MKKSMKIIGLHPYYVAPTRECGRFHQQQQFHLTINSDKEKFLRYIQYNIMCILCSTKIADVLGERNHSTFKDDVGTQYSETILITLIWPQPSL
jgi:hypothetical protein